SLHDAFPILYFIFSRIFSICLFFFILFFSMKYIGVVDRPNNYVLKVLWLFIIIVSFTACFGDLFFQLIVLLNMSFLYFTSCKKSHNTILTFFFLVVYYYCFVYCVFLLHFFST